MKKLQNPIGYMRVASSLLLSWLVLGASAQVIVTEGGAPPSLASLITGNGVQILNPQLNCAQGAYGTYNFNSVTGWADGTGLMLSTGKVVDIYGPNTSESTTTEWGTPGDAQLSFLAGGTSYDACIFEFDVVPVGDTLRFNFVFASEEYQEYVGTVFNDVFGFFISGPGITGTPGLGGAMNIAVVPGTSTPVSINTVNNGNPSIGFPAVNPQFFVANPLSFTSPVQYDGWTQNLFAQAIVTPCDTFHLKLAIADVGDRKWDSSVFIDAIESNAVTITASTEGGIDYMVEGCNNGTVTFTRSPVTSQPLIVTYFVQGTATNGVDYPLIGGNPDPDAPKTVVIPANEASVSFFITPFDDGIEEGEEFIAFYIGNPFCEGTIQDSLLFAIRDNLEVSVSPVLAYVCLGDSLAFEVTGDGFQFQWSPADYLSDASAKEPVTTPLQNTLYTITSTVSTCVATAQSDIRVTNVTLSATTSNVSCAGAGDGSITLVQNGGEEPVEYLWSGPGGFTSTSQSLSNLVPGTYEVLVADRDGCTAALSVTINSGAALTVQASSPTFPGGSNVSCFAADNGQATATVSGGSPPYTFLWNDPLSQTAATATGLAAGTYQVVATDANGCQAQTTIQLVAPAPIVGTLLNRTDVLCHGESTGTATVGAQGGSAPYTFIWNTSPLQSGAQATGLAQGLYLVTITDVNGCTGNIEIEITQPSAPLSLSANTTGTTCNDTTNGTASAVVSGGTPEYTYAWSAPDAGNSPTVTGLAAGAYTLTVTDGNGCQSAVAFSIEGPAELEVAVISLVNVACAGGSDGSAAVLATGGTAPYQYLWNTLPPVSSNELTEVPSGTYIVTATDANGCQATESIQIGEPSSALTVAITDFLAPTCRGDGNGEITALATGGTPPYAYSWNTTPPQTTGQIDGLVAGTYTVQVSDANGCTAQTTQVLTEPDAIVISLSQLQNVTCFGGSTGLAAVIASGSVGPYSYQWDDPLAQDSPLATGLAAGTYTVTVTDDLSCTSSLTVLIQQPTSALSGNVVSSTDVVCNGDNTGEIIVSASGGSGSYTFQWNDPLLQQGTVASGLSAGTYTVTITDNNGCPDAVILEVTLVQPSEPLDINLIPSLFAGGFNLSCFNDDSGTITAETTGGTPPYSIVWDLPGLDTATGISIVNLNAGTYGATLTDAAGCSVSEYIDMTMPEQISITSVSTPSECFGVPSGSLSIEIFGGVPPYSASWIDPDGAFFDTGTSFSNLVGGIYNVIIQDANGCTYLDAVTVVQPENITITIDSISDYGGFNTTCWNSQDGAIFITPSGGNAPYSFVWNRPGEPEFSNQEDVSGLPPVTHEVVVTDASGCVQNAIIPLTSPPAIDIDFVVSTYGGGFNISCFNASDGSVEATAQGGVGGYSYTWIGEGGFGPLAQNPITGLPPGEYSVLVTDANGCIATESVLLSSPGAYSVTLVPQLINGNGVSCFGQNDGSIIVITSGGLAPFSASWTGPSGYTSSAVNISGLIAGEYCLDLTDAIGCVVSACAELMAPNAINIALDATLYPNGLNLSCAGGDNGTVQSTITGGTAPYAYSWTGPGNFTAFTQNLSDVEAGSYCLTVFDGNQCSTTECIDLTAPAPLELSVGTTDGNPCEGDGLASIGSAVAGGSGPYTYAWTGPGGFASSDPSLSNLIAGLYCLTVTDSEGCETSACAEVVSPAALGISIQASAFTGGFGVSCNGAADGFAGAVVNGGTPPYQYTWSGPNGFNASLQSIGSLAPGFYCVDVTDSNGCTGAACITLTEPMPFVLNPSVTLPACNSGDAAQVDLNASGGTAPYIFLWSTGETTEMVVLPEGNYNILAQDANGCIVAESFNIEVDDELLISLQSPVVPGGVNIGCNGASTGAINLSILTNGSIDQIAWTGPGGFTSGSQNISALQAGQYCVTVTTTNGCEATECITLTEPAPLSLNLIGNDITCFGSLNGSALAVVNGGVPTYVINWTGPGGFSFAGPSPALLAEGTYCATATDVNGCQVVECVAINEPALLTINLQSPEVNGFNIACFGESTGAINSTPSGGSGPYAFIWSGPGGFTSDAQNLSDLPSGEYCLAMSDLNGCSTESCIMLTEAPGVEVAISLFEYAPGFNTSCSGVCDGAINATISGGAMPVGIAWEGPDGFSSSLNVLTGLCAGTYTYTTTDANGCQQTGSVTLTEPDAIQLTLNSPVFGGGFEISCTGAANGTINPVITGGTPPYSFLYSGPGGFNSTASNPDGLAPGNYQATLTDASGCSTAASIVLNEPEESLTATAVPLPFPSGNHISCFGAIDGSVITTPMGGTPPFAYNWLGPNDFNATTQNLSNLPAGSYTLVIEDANSCVYTVIVDLTEPDSALEANATIETEVLCEGSTTGAISLSPTGGSDPYSVLWTGSGGFTSTEFALSDLAAGIYSFSLTDLNGCTEFGSIELIEGPALVADATITPPECSAANGSISLSMSGGTEPYTFAWSTGASGPAIDGLSQGAYTAVVTDAQGCTSTFSFELPSTNTLDINVVLNNPNCFGQNSGSISLTVAQGAAPVIFAWSGPDGFTSEEEDINNLTAGTYELLAVDANGCIYTDSWELTEPEPLVIVSADSPLYPNGFNVSAFGANDGNISTPVVTGGTEPYSFFWTGPAGFAFEGEGALSGLRAGAYRLVVIDDNFCEDTLHLILREPVILELPNGISPNGDGANDFLIVRGLDDFPNNKLFIFNRWGNLLYEEQNYRNATPWEGTNNSGERLPEGTYFVIVELPNRDDLRGYLELRR